MALGYKMREMSPGRFYVFAKTEKLSGQGVPVGEVHSGFGAVVAQVWGEHEHPVTFGNVQDAASWVAYKAVSSGRVLL